MSKTTTVSSMTNNNIVNDNNNKNNNSTNNIYHDDDNIDNIDDVYNMQCDTRTLLPHYHNPLTSLFFCNASTGEGLRHSMEWLIPLSKKEYKVRSNNTMNDDDDYVDDDI